MKILVTGANGMLGQDLCPILEEEDYEVIETDVDNLDITNEIQVNRVIQEEKPDYVIHCAAYTNVDKAESDVDFAIKLNVVGTENVAKACAKNDATLVYISTDFVFDGEKKTPYVPSDIPNPLSVYGKTKLQGEEMVQKYCEKYYITRTSWLYGHHGKNFVETILALKENPNLKIVDDQIGCPTWTVELANGIADLIDEEPEYGIYHICGSGSTSWNGFAKEFGVDAKKCTSEEYPCPARRPKYSVMENNGICRDWKLALKDYMALRIED